MHLQGKELISTATQKGARQLVATALTVLLAKVYGVDLSGLEVFGVSIDPSTVAGAVWIVVAFQLATFLVHWGGDWIALAPVNGPEKVNGVSRFDVGARLLTQVEAVSEMLEIVGDGLRHLPASTDQNALREFTAQVEEISKSTQSLRRSARQFSWYGGFYFFGLYLALPIALSLAALFWPSPNA